MFCSCILTGDIAVIKRALSLTIIHKYSILLRSDTCIIIISLTTVGSCRSCRKSVCYVVCKPFSYPNLFPAPGAYFTALRGKRLLNP